MPDGKPSSAGVQAIEDALGQGIVVASVSGRNIDRSCEPFQHVLPIFDRLYIIANNGSIIVSPVENGRRELLFEQRIPHETLFEVLDYIDQHGHNFVYSWLRMTPDGAKDSVITNRKTASIEAIISQNGAQIAIDTDILSQLKAGDYPPPPKLLILPGLEHREAVFQDMKNTFGDRLYLVKTSPDRIEIMHPGVNKKEGIAHLTRRYGISLDDVMAVGDGENDLPMLCNAGLGVVMGDATESVRKEGEARGLVIGPPHHEDGFAWAIRKFALDEQV
jgi:hypothetical protein